MYPKPNDLDPRDRCKSESLFLNYISNCGFAFSPKLIYSDLLNHFNILSWIDGKEVFELNTKDIDSIISFIAILNLPDNISKHSFMLPNASGACIDNQSLPITIKSMLSKIQDAQVANDSLSLQIQNWIHDVLAPLTHYRLKKYENLLSKVPLHTSYACTYCSPSDVGIHNMLRFGSKLYFFDFEYAGLDDISKLSADWVTQPEYPFTQTQELHFLTTLKNTLNVSDKWHSRYYLIKPLVTLKWALIMLRPYRLNKINTQTWNKIIEYFDSSINNHDFNL